MMLQSIDILIGLSVIMLVASMAVTMLTQAVIAVTGSRGRNLLNGLIGLIEQLDPKFSRKHAREIVKMILLHERVNGGKILGIVRYGDIIHRAELTKILLELACKANSSSHALNKSQHEAVKALKHFMATNGITHPEQTLDKVHLFALEIEKECPEIASNVRHEIALMQHAYSQFLAKINMKFDSVVDRIGDRFTFSARIMTFFSAILVAVALQLDTVTLVNRLAIDDATRSAIVGAALNMQSQQANSEKQIDQTNEVAFEVLSGNAKMLYRAVADEGILTVPKIDLTQSSEQWVKKWMASWQHVNPIGVLISILLLSLGAPFWYGMLNKLLQLRSAIAQRDDSERQNRQTEQKTKNSEERLASLLNQSSAVKRDTNTVGGEEYSAAKATMEAAGIKLTDTREAVDITNKNTKSEKMPNNQKSKS